MGLGTRLGCPLLIRNKAFVETAQRDAPDFIRGRPWTQTACHAPSPLHQAGGKQEEREKLPERGCSREGVAGPSGLRGGTGRVCRFVKLKAAEQKPHRWPQRGDTRTLPFCHCFMLGSLGGSSRGCVSQDNQEEETGGVQLANGLDYRVRGRSRRSGAQLGRLEASQCLSSVVLGPDPQVMEPRAF